MSKRFMVAIVVGLCWCSLAAWPQPSAAQEGKVIISQSRTGAAAEDAIRAALRKPCELKFVEQPLHDVIEQIQDTYEIGVKIDERALDAVGLGKETPVTINIKNVSLKSALELTLNDLDLTWMIRHEVLVVTTREEAEAHLSTRVYEVRDLVLLKDGQQRPIVYESFGGFGGDADFDSLIETITSIVHPETWDEVGGPGSINGITFSGKYALVVSQTEQVHEQIEELLASLRQLKAAPDAGKEEDKDVSVDKKNDVFVQVYPIMKTARSMPEELAELVKSALDDENFEETQGTFVRGVAETVIVKHNSAVQKRVRELLRGVGAFEPTFPGGFGSGSTGVPNGAGVQGGGFF